MTFLLLPSIDVSVMVSDGCCQCLWCNSIHWYKHFMTSQPTKRTPSGIVHSNSCLPPLICEWVPYISNPLLLCPCLCMCVYWDKESGQTVHCRETDSRLNSRLAEVYHELEVMEADRAPARAGTILAGLGFSPEMQRKVTRYMSCMSYVPLSTGQCCILTRCPMLKSKCVAFLWNWCNVLLFYLA